MATPSAVVLLLHHPGSPLASSETDLPSRRAFPRTHFAGAEPQAVMVAPEPGPAFSFPGGRHSRRLLQRCPRQGGVSCARLTVLSSGSLASHRKSQEPNSSSHSRLLASEKGHARRMLRGVTSSGPSGPNRKSRLGCLPGLGASLAQFRTTPQLSFSGSRKMFSNFHLDPILKLIPPPVTSCQLLRYVDFISENILSPPTLLHFCCYCTNGLHHHHGHLLWSLL